MVEHTPSAKSKHGHAFIEMCKGRWREFRREPSAFFFVLFMPLLWMAILGFAFSGNRLETYGLGWPKSSVALDPLVSQVHDSLSKNPQVRLIEGDGESLNTALLRGDILLIVHPDVAGKPWTYSFDPANREASRARVVIDDLAQMAAGRQDILRTQDEAINVPGTRYIDFLVPGLVALSIMTSSLFGIGATIVVNRRENLLKRYLVTPMQPTAYILSHVVGRFFILAVELAAILIGGLAMFKFQVHGNIFSFIAFAMLGAAAFTAIAILCGSRTSNMAVMNGMTNLISVPMMIVAGVWFARANFPTWIAGPAQLLPLTALVDGLRRIALEGATLANVASEAMVLIVYLVAAIIASRKLFKWY